MNKRILPALLFSQKSCKNMESSPLFLHTIRKKNDLSETTIYVTVEEIRPYDMSERFSLIFCKANYLV